MADLRGPLLENIAFLSQFANRGRALRDPVVNLQPLITRPRQGEASVKRLLNFDQERRLAEAFALVLATNEIAAQVMAICIEQKPDRTGFTVRIATNSGLSDNKQQLFNKIIAAARLEIKSNENLPLLTEIITANQSRILGRLRSKHANKSKNNEPARRAIIEQLDLALKKVPHSNLQPSESYLKTRRLVSSWLELYRKLEDLRPSKARSKPGVNILVQLVLELSEQLDVESLADILSTLKSKDSPWPNSRYERVLRTYSKVSQYKRAADYIGYMVRRYSRWDIEGVSGAPFELHVVGAELDEHEGLGFFSRSKKRSEFQAQLVDKLGKKLPKIKDGIDNAAGLHKKVHAEIQLLYHYAQNPDVLFKPRVLCSNKEACYLCHLFIAVHGQFHTPRSHGNFYPEWRLPRMDEIVLSKASKKFMRQTVSRFNTAVEDRIRNLLETPRTVRPIPSESTIFSVGSWAPSILSSVLGSKPARIAKSTPLLAHPETKSTKINATESRPTRNRLTTGDDSQPQNTALKPNGKAERTQEDNIPREIESSHTQAAVTQEAVTHPNPAPAASKQNTASNILHSSPSGTSQDKPIEPAVLSLNGIPAGRSHHLSHRQKTTINIRRGKSARFKVPGLHIEFSYEGSADEHTSSAAGTAVLHLEWLASQDMKHAGRAEYVDLEAAALENEVSHPGIFGNDGIVLVGKGQNVLMRVE